MNIQITAEKLSQFARLADLSISRLVGGRRDDKATEEVEKKHHIESGTGGQFVKALVNPAYLKAINKASSRIRENFYKFTLPWHGEQRVLPVSVYDRFSEVHNKLVAEFDKLADELASKYDEILSEAKQRLNGLYRPDEYPETSNIFRDKFAVNLDQFSFPRETDLRDPELQARALQAVSGRLAVCHAKLLDRVIESLQKFGATLAKSDAIFRDSLVGNIREALDEADALNFTGDSRIAEGIATVRAGLWGHLDADLLRENQYARTDAVKKSEEVLKAIYSLKSTLGASA